MISVEGTVEIDLVEFWRFLYKQEEILNSLEFVALGVPRINKDNQTIEIDFAGSSTCEPETWLEKPKAVTQWEEKEE